MINKKDEQILESFKHIVKGLSLFLGPDTEIALHSFKDPEHSIIAIENGYITNRSVGSTLTEAGLKIVNELLSKQKDAIGPYKSISPDGKILRSITIPIRNEKRKIIGLLCLNTNISKFIEMEEFTTGFTNFPEEKIENGKLEKKGTTSLNNLEEHMFDEVLTRANSKGSIQKKEKNRFIVEELYKKDFFNLKDSVDFVAQKLDVTIFTIYNYLRAIKNRRGGKNGKKHYRKNP